MLADFSTGRPNIRRISWLKCQFDRRHVPVPVEIFVLALWSHRYDDDPIIRFDLLHGPDRHERFIASVRAAYCTFQRDDQGFRPTHGDHDRRDAWSLRIIRPAAPPV